MLRKVGSRFSKQGESGIDGDRPRDAYMDVLKQMQAPTKVRRSRLRDALERLATTLSPMHHWRFDAGRHGCAWTWTCLDGATGQVLKRGALTFQRARHARRTLRMRATCGPGRQ